MSNPAADAEYKIKFDIEQLEDIAQVRGGDTANWIRREVLPAFKNMLLKIPPLSQLQRTAGLFPFALAPVEAAALRPYYGRALFMAPPSPPKPPTPRVGLLHAEFDAGRVEREYLSSSPRVAVIDNVLSPEALTAVREALAGSTVWHEVLLDLAAELADRLPGILGEAHPLRHLWAYAYDERYGGINVHADDAAVNLNLWIAPEDACLDKESGGLVVYTVKPPAEWPFSEYNTLGEGGAAAALLRGSGYANVTVPHRENRLVMFDSALLHRTDAFTFRPGFRNRRINLTLLYGHMDRSPAPPLADPPGAAGPPAVALRPRGPSAAGGADNAGACGASGAGGGGDR